MMQKWYYALMQKCQKHNYLEELTTSNSSNLIKITQFCFEPKFVGIHAYLRKKNIIKNPVCANKLAFIQSGWGLCQVKSGHLDVGPPNTDR